MVGNVVQRDDALYARMKQRDIDVYDSMWDPIFADDAALGLGEQRLKVPAPRTRDRLLEPGEGGCEGR